MTNTQTDSDCPVTNAHGQAGGLYYPSQGAYGLQEALGLTDEQRNAIADELRAAYYLARTEGEEKTDDRIRSEERDSVSAEVDANLEAAAAIWDRSDVPHGRANARAIRLAAADLAAAISKTERTEG